MSSSSSRAQRTKGRRHRPTSETSIHKSSTTIGTAASTSNTIGNGKSVSDAKARFVGSVSRGISVLMEECGYSRERATAALLREITRGDNSSSPDEKEVSLFLCCSVLRRRRDGQQGVHHSITMAAMESKGSSWKV